MTNKKIVSDNLQYSIYYNVHINILHLYLETNNLLFVALKLNVFFLARNNANVNKFKKDRY